MKRSPKKQYCYITHIEKASPSSKISDDGCEIEMDYLYKKYYKKGISQKTELQGSPQQQLEELRAHCKKISNISE